MNQETRLRMCIIFTFLRFNSRFICFTFPKGKENEKVFWFEKALSMLKCKSFGAVFSVKIQAECGIGRSFRKYQDKDAQKGAKAFF